MDLIELPREQLYIGLSLPYTLRDSSGAVLLVRDQVIETPGQLDGIKARGKVFVEIDQTEEGVRALMSGLQTMDRVGAPIKDFSRYLAQKRAREQGVVLGNLAQRWGDLESRLAGTLASVAHVDDLAQRFVTIDQQIVQLLAEDTWASLFVLFHRAVTHYDSYSVKHALLCAALTCKLADIFEFQELQRRNLCCAALSMNIAMTQLQNVLAQQRTPLSVAQRREVDHHSADGRAMLEAGGVTDKVWLELVDKHHTPLRGPDDFSAWAPLPRLCKVLQVVDRYTAAISPRRSRSGRNARESVRTVVLRAESSAHDPVGTALVQLLGLAPPGTYVHLDSGETGVVLRRGERAAEPIVAILLNRADEPIAEPRLLDTGRGAAKMDGTLSADGIRLTLSMAAMLRLLDRAAVL